jgi:hypothetical protein
MKAPFSVRLRSVANASLGIAARGRGQEIVIPVPRLGPRLPVAGGVTVLGSDLVAGCDRQDASSLNALYSRETDVVNQPKHALPRARRFSCATR